MIIFLRLPFVETLDLSGLPEIAIDNLANVSLETIDELLLDFVYKHKQSLADFR